MDFWEAMSQPAIIWHYEEDDSQELEAIKKQNKELRKQNDQLKELIMELREGRRIRRANQTYDLVETDE
jgi:transposase-like protein